MISLSKRELGRKLRESLLNSSSIEQIAKWADRMYNDHFYRTTEEIDAIIDSLAMMDLGAEFSYTEAELWKLVELLENDADDPLNKIQ